LAITNKAFSNGYWLLAYEAAYILKQWIDDAETHALYEEIAGHFDFQPVLSHISRQSEWEKSLNAFLSMGGGKGKSGAKDEQGKYRVVYYVNFKNINIQPVLQTRTAKGAWTTGRNIALKTFYQGKVEGMTQQDYRIAKQVKLSSSYYNGDEYYFQADTLKELVGHPFVFLAGTEDLSVEIVAAQPELRVIKTPKGFTLETDIKDTSDELIVVKETNTRYKVYDLSNQQNQVIEAIKQQKIVVPEAGKDKLMQVLGNFSSHFTVHSDLAVNESTRLEKWPPIRASGFSCCLWAMG
jgi:hypothetical protein